MNLRTDIYDEINREACEKEKLDIFEEEIIDDSCLCGKRAIDGNFCSEHCKAEFEDLFKDL